MSQEPVYPSKHPMTGARVELPTVCPLHPGYTARRPPRSVRTGCVCSLLYRVARRPPEA